MSTPDSAIGYVEVSQSPPRTPRSDSSDDAILFSWLVIAPVVGVFAEDSFGIVGR